MANRSGYHAPSADSVEKICGPACSVVPNKDGRTPGHVHRPVTRLTADGFPYHQVYPEPPTKPPKAFYGFERKGGLRRSVELPSGTRPQTLLDDPELTAYSTGRIQDLSEGSRQHWRHWRFWEPRNRNEYGLDGEAGVELRNLPRSEAWWSGQQPSHAEASDVAPRSDSHSAPPGSSEQSFNAERYIPSTYATPVRRSLSTSTDTTSVETLPNLAHEDNDATRSPAAHGPVLRCTNPDADSIFSTQKSADFHVAEAGPSTGRDFSSRFPRYRAVEHPETDRSGAQGRLGHHKSPPVSRSRTQPSSPLASQPPVPRAGSWKAAALRSRASTTASRPETRPLSPDPEEQFTLRHVQRVCLNRVKPRLFAIEENRKRFEAIKTYEVVGDDIFKYMHRIKGMKGSIDADNLRFGSHPEEDQAWIDFLTELEFVERAIEAEDERLRIVTEIRRAEREKESLSKEKETAGKETQSPEEEQASEHKQRAFREGVETSNEEQKASDEGEKVSNDEQKSSKEEQKASHEERKASQEEQKASKEDQKASKEELKASGKAQRASNKRQTGQQTSKDAQTPPKKAPQGTKKKERTVFADFQGLKEAQQASKAELKPAQADSRPVTGQGESEDKCGSSTVSHKANPMTPASPTPSQRASRLPKPVPRQSVPSK